MADLVTTALQEVVTQVQDASSTLVPIGTSVAGGLIVLSILMLGAAIMGGTRRSWDRSCACAGRRPAPCG